MESDRIPGTPCVGCDGEGWVEYTPMAGMMHDFADTCDYCNGTGVTPA